MCIDKYIANYSASDLQLPQLKLAHSLHCNNKYISGIHFLHFWMVNLHYKKCKMAECIAIKMVLHYEKMDTDNLLISQITTHSEL